MDTQYITEKIGLTMQCTWTETAIAVLPSLRSAAGDHWC